MGRTRHPEIRDRILESCVDHVLAHGLPDRLRPLADAAATSNRMLIYHFGTKEALLQEILRHARRRQRAFYGGLLQYRQDEPYLTTLRGAWRTITGPKGRPYLGLFGKLREDAEQQLWPSFRREATTDWLQPLEDGMRHVGRSHLATLVLAVIRGLILDVEATDDIDRANAAFDDFLSALAAMIEPTNDATSERT